MWTARPNVYHKKTLYQTALVALIHCSYFEVERGAVTTIRTKFSLAEFLPLAILKPRDIEFSYANPAALAHKQYLNEE